MSQPEEIAPALRQAKEWVTQYRVPMVVEMLVERVTNVSMGMEIDGVTEFEDLAAHGEDAPTAVYAALD